MVTLPILSLFLYALFPAKYEHVKQVFTLQSTDKSVESIPAKRCSEIVKSLEEQTAERNYLQMTGKSSLYLFEPGIHAHTDQTITIFSRGIHGFKGIRNSTFFNISTNLGKSFIAAYKYTQVGLIQTPSIGFDYIDSWPYFDHACEQRVQAIKPIIEEVQKKTDSIILFGDSNGAKAILNSAEKVPFEKVKAIVLESPVLSLKNLSKNAALNYTSKLPYGKKVVYTAFRVMAPFYTIANDFNFDKVKKIPKNIPIFIGHLHNDELIDNASILKLVSSLRESGHTVYLLVIDDPKTRHSRIAVNQPFIKAVNAFYKAHNLPYDETLAQEGAEILDKALQNGTDGTITSIEQVS